MGSKKNSIKFSIDDLFVEATAVKLFFKERLYIVKIHLEELANYNQPDKNASHISSYRVEMSTSEKKVERKR